MSVASMAKRSMTSSGIPDNDSSRILAALLLDLRSQFPPIDFDR